MNRLPPHLLTHIFTFLPDYTTASSVSLVSKPFRAALHPARPSIAVTWFTTTFANHDYHPLLTGRLLYVLLELTTETGHPWVCEQDLKIIWPTFQKMYLEEALMPIGLRIARLYLLWGQRDEAVSLLKRIYCSARPFYISVPPGIQPFGDLGKYLRALEKDRIGKYPIARELKHLFETNASNMNENNLDELAATLGHTSWTSFTSHVQNLEKQYRTGHILLLGEPGVGQLRRTFLPRSRGLMDDGILFRDEDVDGVTNWPCMGREPAFAIMRMTKWGLNAWRCMRGEYEVG